MTPSAVAGGVRKTRWTRENLVGGVRHQTLPSFGSGLGSLWDGIEQPDEVGLAIDLYSDRPAPGPGVVADAADSGSRRLAGASVLGLFRDRYDAEVSPSVVQGLTVDVVYLTRVALLQPHQEAVKTYLAAIDLASDIAAVIASPRTRQNPSILVIDLGVALQASVTGVEREIHP